MDYLSNPVEALAAAVHAACLRDLSDIRYMTRDWEKIREMSKSKSQEERAALHAGEGPMIEKARRPELDDVHVRAMFAQTWGSTALGFGGMGGAAMTTAYSIVIESERAQEIAVYFGNHGRLAYIIPLGSASEGEVKAFYDDIASGNLVACSEAAKKYGAVQK